MLELLQNADDCDFAPGVKPSLTVTFELLASLMIYKWHRWTIGHVLIIVYWNLFANNLGRLLKCHTVAVQSLLLVGSELNSSTRFFRGLGCKGSGSLKTDSTMPLTCHGALCLDAPLEKGCSGSGREELR